MVRDDVRLVLTTTYMPQTPVLWAGSSYFGGKEDQLVLCAGKGKLVSHDDLYGLNEFFTHYYFFNAQRVMSISGIVRQDENYIISEPKNNPLEI